MLIFFVFFVSFSLYAVDCPLRPLDLPLNADVSLDASDCVGQDILPSASTLALSDIRTLNAHVYALTVPDGGGVFTVGAASTTFPPFVTVVNDQNEILSYQLGSTTAAAAMA